MISILQGGDKMICVDYWCDKCKHLLPLKDGWEMVSKNIINSLISSGQQYYAQYLIKYGEKEPLWERDLCLDEDIMNRELLAKRCIKAGKTATELGIVATAELQDDEDI